jgi:hypothetical protein
VTVFRKVALLSHPDNRCFSVRLRGRFSVPTCRIALRRAQRRSRLAVDHRRRRRGLDRREHGATLYQVGTARFLSRHTIRKGWLTDLLPAGLTARCFFCLPQWSEVPFGFELPVREHRAMAPSHGFAAASHRETALREARCGPPIAKCGAPPPCRPPAIGPRGAPHAVRPMARQRFEAQRGSVRPAAAVSARTFAPAAAPLGALGAGTPSGYPLSRLRLAREAHTSAYLDLEVAHSSGRRVRNAC